MGINTVKGLTLTCGGNYRNFQVRTLNEKTRQDNIFNNKFNMYKKGKIDSRIVFANFGVICGELNSESG